MKTIDAKVFDYSVHITEAQRKLRALEDACLKACVDDSVEGYEKVYSLAADSNVAIRMVLEWAGGKASALRMTERR